MVFGEDGHPANTRTFLIVTSHVQGVCVLICSLICILGVEKKVKTCSSEVNISNQIYGLFAHFRISLPPLTFLHPTLKAL